MPEHKVTVYSVEDGAPMLMHSVDAQEALALGHYRATPPVTEEVVRLLSDPAPDEPPARARRTP
jgi:hypothetical protein